MGKKTSILLVSHNIFLSRQERYTLINGESVRTMGVSLPVWFTRKNTFNQNEEVFCKYDIHNNPNEPSGTLQIITEGYRINLPQLPKGWKPTTPLTDEQWMQMDEKELAMWYKKYGTPPNANYLKDIPDGGSEYLRFKYVGEFEEKEKPIQIMHYCELKTLETLQKSLI